MLVVVTPRPDGALYLACMFTLPCCYWHGRWRTPARGRRGVPWEFLRRLFATEQKTLAPGPSHVSLTQNLAQLNQRPQRTTAPSRSKPTLRTNRGASGWAAPPLICSAQAAHVN